MTRLAAIMATVLWVTSFGWTQSCPSASDLHAINKHYAACPLQSAAGWVQGSNITVYEVSIPLLMPAIQAAYGNWSSRLGSGVTIQQIEHEPTTPPVSPFSMWQYGSTSECNGETACTYEWYACSGGWMQHTSTNILTGYPGPGYQLFAHEVGHTYGIDDCTGSDCLEAVTIMQPNIHANHAMSPHCCDSKLMYDMTLGAYGQSANFCSPTLVQGTATISQQSGLNATATFQQNVQSGDSIVVGCLGSYSGAASFTGMDNQQNGSYNPVVSTVIPPPNPGPIAAGSLFSATQVASSQSQPPSITVTCSAATGSAGLIDVFALEYADLASWPDLDGNPGSNYNEYSGVSPLSCGSLSTTAVNDLIVSLYNYNVYPLPTDSAASPRHPHGIAPDSSGIAPTLGTVPPCSGGQGGECIAQPGLPLEYPQAGGVSTYAQDTPPGPYTEAWTSPLYCPPNEPCWFPMSCVSAAVNVIGP